MSDFKQRYVMNILTCNKKGISLISSILALAVVSIIMAGITSALVYMMKETRNLESKLGVLELQRNLTSISPGLNICAAAVAANTALFSADKSEFLNSTFGISKIALDPDGRQIIVENNVALLGVSHIKAKNLRITNLFEVSGRTMGDLIVDFDADRSIRSLSNRVAVQTEKVGTKINITGCSTSANTGEIPNTPILCTDMGGGWVNNACEFPSSPSVAKNCGLSNCRTVTGNYYDPIGCSANEVVAAVISSGNSGGHSGVSGLTCCVVSCN